MYPLSYFFILVMSVTIASAALTPADIMQVISVRRQCERKNPIDPSIRERIGQGELINDRNFDCFIACMLQGTNLMSSNGVLNTAAAIDKVPDTLQYRNEIVNAINTCSGQRGNDACSSANMLYVCFNEQNIPALLKAVLG